MYKITVRKPGSSDDGYLYLDTRMLSPQDVQVKDIEDVIGITQYLMDLQGWTMHNRWKMGGAMDYTQHYILRRFQDIIQRYHSR